MFARNLLAMTAMLLCWSAKPCLASGLEVGVYLRSDGAAPAPVLAAMKNELDSILNRAGFEVRWWSRGSSERIEAPELIVVDMRGSCQPPATASVGHAGALELELGSTAVTGREILPFSSLDCETLNGMLAGPLLRSPAGQRQLLYGRALARILAHEFYHVLARTQAHGAQGLSKKAYSADDLLARSFEFDAHALAQLAHVSVRAID